MKVLFVRSGNAGDDPISTRQGLSLIKMAVEVDFFDITGKGFIGYLSNLRKLKKIIKSKDPDIIHAHYSLSGILSVFARYNKPIICSLMGSDINQSSWLHRLIIKIFVKKFWDQTIVKSEKMRSALKLGFVHVIPNGVDFSIFKPISQWESRNLLGWKNDRIHIIFASDPKRKEKNYILAEKALNLLDVDFDLHFLMDIKPENIYLYYNAADILLLTSLSEGSPNVIKEAMACNCPIVATDVGDISELISEVEGCYITGFDPEDVRLKLSQAIKFGKRTNGREKSNRFDSRIIAFRIDGVYKSLIKK